MWHFDVRWVVHGVYEECFVCFWCISPQLARASSFTRFLDHTKQCTTVGRIPLDERSARHIDLYWTTDNIHSKHLFTPVGFEPAISAGEQPQTYVLDLMATGTGFQRNVMPSYSGCRLVWQEWRLDTWRWMHRICSECWEILTQWLTVSHTRRSESLQTPLCVPNLTIC